MPLTREQRLEYLQKAREAKKAKAEEAQKLTDIIPSEITKKATEGLAKQKKQKIKTVKKTLDLDLTKEIQMDAKREEEERLINQVIKVKAPAKKRIIKRVIEVEEPSTDEEIQEEVVIKPRARAVKKEVVQTDEVQTQASNALSLLRSVEDHASGNTKNNNLYRDIFPD